MSLLFNTRPAKCIKIILPLVKHISTNNNQRVIAPNALPNLKQSLLTPLRYTWPNHKIAAKSIIFGCSLIGLIGLEKKETNRELIDIIKKGLLFLKNNNYSAFEQTLHEALKVANDSNNADSITYVYDVLANGALKNKDNEKAIDLFTKIVKRLIDQGYPKDDLTILYLSFKISKLYEIQKEYKYSEFGYVYCLRCLEKKLKKYPLNREILSLYADTVDAYGRYLMNKEDINMAKIAFKKAYTANVMLYGELFEYNVILLNVLGTLYFDQGNINKSMFYFRKAKKIGEYFPNLKCLAVVYINLGNAYLKQGMLKKAEKNCLEGLKNSKRHGIFEGKKEAEVCLARIHNALMKQNQNRKVGK